jgi:hypothetical protein
LGISRVEIVPKGEFIGGETLKYEVAPYAITHSCVTSAEKTNMKVA